MSSQHVHFKVGSRKAFAEESPVVDAAERAAVEVAEKRGNSADGALFKVIVRGSGSVTVPAQAVDIIRDAFDKFNAANVGAAQGMYRVSLQKPRAMVIPKLCDGQERTRRTGNLSSLCADWDFKRELENENGLSGRFFVLLSAV